MADISRGEVQDLLAKFAASDPKYRTALLNDPRSIVEKQLNTTLPANMKVKTVEDTADTMYVVVPFVPRPGEELSDSALEMIAGGFLDHNCSRALGGINTHVEIRLV